MSESVTREGVLAALRARRVYATNGPRIWLQVTLDGEQMGSTIHTAQTPAGGDGGRVLRVRAIAPRPIANVELIRSGQIIEPISGAGTEMTLERTFSDMHPDEYLYARVV